MNITCNDCHKLVGRNRECETCCKSTRKVALVDEFISPGSKTMLGFQLMQRWMGSGGEVVFSSLEFPPPEL